VQMTAWNTPPSGLCVLYRISCETDFYLFTRFQFSCEVYNTFDENQETFMLNFLKRNNWCQLYKTSLAMRHKLLVAGSTVFVLLYDYS